MMDVTDDRLILVFWVIGGAAFLAIIGALFGGLAGFMARLDGREPGGIVGWHVLRAVERGLHRKLPSPHAGVLVGAFDGAAFLGAIGAILGLLAAKAEWFSNRVLLASLFGIAIVAGLAVVFGLAAYLFSRGGVVVFGTACAGGVAGIYLGAMLAEAGGILIGGGLGLLAGFAIAWLGQRRRMRNGRSNQIPVEWEDRER
jgi:MFS family permease